MKPFTYDTGPLCALLAADFDVILRDIQEYAHVDELVDSMMDAVLCVLRDKVACWNERNLVYRLPPELLASTLAFLPFRDRISASHVSRAWRQTAVSFPSVWESIEIDHHFSEPAELAIMALDRVGIHPADLSFSSGSDEPDSGRRALAACIRPHIHHLRTLSWHDEPPTLIYPAPLLESLNIAWDLVVSNDFLGGKAGSLKTLCTRVLHLPTVRHPALFSVTVLAVQLPPHLAPQGPYSRFFAQFPHLRSLALYGIQFPHLQVLSQTHAPDSLTQVLLESLIDRGAFDLFALWQTPHMKQVTFHVPSITTNIVSRFIGIVQGCTELRVLAPDWIVARDAAGRHLALVSNLPSRRTELAAIVAPAAPALRSLRALYIDIRVLQDNIMDTPHDQLSLPAVEHLTLYFSDEVQVLAPGLPPRREKPWWALRCLQTIGRILPALQTLEMIVRGARMDREEAWRLLVELAGLGELQLPILSVSGFPEDVASAMDDLLDTVSNIAVVFSV